MVDVGGQPIDRYVVLQHLSEGGMGAIYVGKKLGAGGFEMAVVLKQLLPEFTQQEEFIDLFLREAKLSATLDHANIVHTIDLVTAGGEYFIVMEYLPGGDLRTLLKRAKRRGKRFSPAAAIYIAREVLSALAYAHVKRDFDGAPLKLIHRDVSPSNILISYSGEVKLTDFGIAKAATHTSLFYKVKGKIGYMSPEQARSETLDSRSDLYSLAVCLYEILTGERLFIHAGLTTSAEEIYSQPVPSLIKKVPGLPPELDAIMQRALAIDPARRFQTAGELNEALTRCAHRNGLLVSAPELSRELLDACGPTEQWRDEDDEDEIISQPRAGTEIYDISDDDDDDDDDDAGERLSDADLVGHRLGSGPMSLNAAAARLNARTPSNPNERPKTEVGRFQGVELTSIINMIDLEQGGSRPLVDLDASPAMTLDSGPQRYPGGIAQLVEPSHPPPDMRPPQPPAMPPQLAPHMPTPYPMAQQPQLSYPVQQMNVRTMQGLDAQQQPKRTTPGTRNPVAKAKKRSSRMPIVVIVAVLLAAGVAAVIVAMSGPNLPAEKR